MEGDARGAAAHHLRGCLRACFSDSFFAAFSPSRLAASPPPLHTSSHPFQWPSDHPQPCLPSVSPVVERRPQAAEVLRDRRLWGVFHAVFLASSDAFRKQPEPANFLQPEQQQQQPEEELAPRGDLAEAMSSSLTMGGDAAEFSRPLVETPPSWLGPPPEKTSVRTILQHDFLQAPLCSTVMPSMNSIFRNDGPLLRRRVLRKVRQRSLESRLVRRTIRYYAKEKEILFDTLRTLMVTAVALTCKLVLQQLNTTEVVGMQHYLDALYSRNRNTGLITASNHTTAVDDPAVLAAMAPLSYLLQSRRVRWAVCARDRCFNHSQTVSDIFATMKVLPIERGAGLDQKDMKSAVEKVSSGDWIHIFPEGTRSRDGKLGKMRPGLGKLVSAAEVVPIVLPIYHLNMEEILPPGSSLPAIGKKIVIFVGEPMDFSCLLRFHELEESRDLAVYTDVSSKVGVELEKLEKKAKKYALRVKPASERQHSPRKKSGRRGGAQGGHGSEEKKKEEQQQEQQQ